jgi:hypothetical protein|nr:hypothetical protein [Kofleriaceae bacterium]
MRNRLVYAITLVVACGGSSSSTVDSGSGGHDGAAGDGAISIDDACTQSATQRCTKLETCSNPDLEKRFGDLATCEAREKLTCVDALGAPDNANTAAAVAGCTAAITGESCADFLADKDPPAACQTLAGSAAAGASCQFAAQCATAFCATSVDDVCGTCAAQPAVGTSCADQGCGQDLICVATTQLCQEPGESGGGCSRDLPCDDDLTCVGSDLGSGGSGTCTPDVETAGSACDRTHKTGAACDPDAGLVCDGLTNQCVAQPIVGAGAACGVIDGVDTLCEAAATCQPVDAGSGSGSGSGSAGSICVANADDGGACDPALGVACLTPAKCVPTGSGSSAGTCVLAGSATCP